MHFLMDLFHEARGTMSSPDPTPLLSSLSTDPDMLDLVEEFVQALPERVHAIEDAVTANDLDTLTRLSHQLKGASGGYGFDTIGQAAATLEQSAKAADSVAQLTSQVRELVNLCQRAKATPP